MFHKLSVVKVKTVKFIKLFFVDSDSTCLEFLSLPNGNY